MPTQPRQILQQPPARRAQILEPGGRPQTTNGSLLFAADVAALVGMTTDWVYAETRAGRIPHLTLGRYYRYRSDSIDAWLREIEQGPLERSGGDAGVR